LIVADFLIRADKQQELQELTEEYSSRDKELKQLQHLMAAGQYEQAAQRVLQSMENSGMGHDEDDFADLPKPPMLSFGEEIRSCQVEMQEWRAYFK
jgi:hypothetical protein